MNQNIAKNVLSNICNEYIDVIMTGLEEEKDKLIYTKALIDFASTVDISSIDEIFVDTFLDKVSKEIIMYLVR